MNLVAYFINPFSNPNFKQPSLLLTGFQKHFGTINIPKEPKRHLNYRDCYFVGMLVQYLNRGLVQIRLDSSSRVRCPLIDFDRVFVHYNVLPKSIGRKNISVNIEEISDLHNFVIHASLPRQSPAMCVCDIRLT